MLKDNLNSNHIKIVQKRIDKLLNEKPKKLDDNAIEDIKHLADGLKVFQAKLEKSHEEGRQTRTDLKTTRAKYDELFDLASVGYFILDEKGHIVKTNRFGASLLGVNGRLLSRKLFATFVAADCKDEFNSHFKRVMETSSKQTCELRLRKKDDSSFIVQMDSKALVSAEDDVRHFHSVITDITAKKDIEVACKQNEEKYRRLAANIPGMIYTFQLKADGSHSFPYASSSSRELFDVESTDLMRDGNLVSGLIHPDDKERRDESIKVSAESLQPWRQELRHVVNGEVRWYDCMSRPEKQANGEIRWDGIIFEITARKRAEQALRESEEKYRNLFETMAQGVVYQDANGKITSANPAAERILGLTLDQMQGRTSFDPRWRALHEDGSDFPGKTHPAMVSLQTGKPVRDVIMGVFNPNDETYRWININAIPQFRLGEKKPYQVYTTFSDITRRKQSEEALRESEEKFRSMFELLPYSAVQLDLKANIQLCNRQFVRFHATREGLEAQIGRNISEFLPPEEIPTLFATIEKTINEGRKVIGPVEYIMRREDGSRFPAEGFSILMVDEFGDPKAVLGLANDITERKHAENLQRIQRDIALALTTSNDISEVSNKILEAIFQIEGIDSGGIYLFDKLTGRLHLVAHRGLSAKFVENTSCYEADSPNVRLVLQGNIVYRDKGADSLTLELLKKESLQTAAVIPVKSEGQILGACNFASRTIDVFPESTRNALETLASQLGIIISRIQTEKALRDTEEKLWLLFESTYDLISLTDSKGKTLWANPAWKKLFSKDTEFQDNPSKLLHPDDLDMVAQKWKALVTKGVAIENMVYRLKVINKGYTYFETSAFFVKIGGEPYYYVVARDITDRKRAENELLKLKNELEIKVAEKTRELQERIAELERFHDATIDRELRMKELRDTIDKLERKLLEKA